MKRNVQTASVVLICAILVFICGFYCCYHWEHYKITTITQFRPGDNFTHPFILKTIPYQTNNITDNDTHVLVPKMR